MKKILISMMAAVACFAAFAQSADDAQQQSLKDKLYMQIIQASNNQNWYEIAKLAEQIQAAGEPLDELTVTYADALLNIGKTQEGINALMPYIDANPDDYMAYKVLGELLEDQGDKDNALIAYQKSVTLRPAYVWPYVNMARIYGKENPAEAMPCYNKAISLFMQADRPDVAISLGSEAMEMGTNNVQFLTLMGNALNQAGMQENALPFYAEAINQATLQGDYNISDVVEAYYNIAMIYYKQGQYSKAVNFLTPAFEGQGIDQIDPMVQLQAYCLAAACQSRVGNDDLSKLYQDKAAALDPDGWHAYYTSLLAR